MDNPRLWQNSDGTWSHHKDSQCKWRDLAGCETDLRFAEEHENRREPTRDNLLFSRACEAVRQANRRR
jgi:hypothetical protein